MTAILTIKSVTKSFETARGLITILDSISLTIKAGEKVAIIGPSGSGKSTLLSLIGLLDVPTAGAVEVDGQNIALLTEPEQAQFRNEKIGFIFQSFELISPFTVCENIVAPLEIGGRVVNQERVQTLIDTLGLTKRAEVLPHTLSGGEKQRVAIARALIHKPALILADEPTGSLDRATGDVVLGMLLEAVAKDQTTLIIITHDESIADRMDRVFEIRDRHVHERQ